MLSIYTLKSAKDAYQYYQQGDYYTKGGTKEHSFWFGKGARHFNLEGPVDFDIFKGLLEGYMPDGGMMHQTKRGQYHRPGYDLTFSAPKSVSILALVAGNQEVLKAWRESIEEVLPKIEKKYGACRHKEKGVTNIEKTENMLFAVFEHSDSRAGDPALHDHCVLLNMTLRLNQDWRTLYADEIYNDKLLNGMELRSILARKLLKLGYELRFGKRGTFEIEAVPLPLIQLFSKRQEEIAQWLKDHNLEGGLAAKTANFQTRQNKKNLDVNERKERWIAEVVAAGFSLEDLEQVYLKAKARGPIELPDPIVIAESSVEVAISHLAERNAYFSIPEVLKASKLMSLFPVADSDFLRVVEAKINNKDLLYVEDKLLTTPHLLELKADIKASMQQTKKSVHKIMVGWVADIHTAFRLKTEAQRTALKCILTTQDQQVLITTDSKPILNEMLTALNKVCQDQHYYPRFLTQKALSAEHLKKKLDSERVGTIEGFLLACEERNQKQDPNPNFLKRFIKDAKRKEARDLWVIHGDVAFGQVKRLQHWAHVFGARLIFTQSIHQNSAALSLLKDEGIEQFEMRAPKYYRKELNVKEELLADVKRLEQKGAIHTIADYEERLKGAIHQGFLEHTIPFFVTLTNAERLTLNEKVREELKEKGILSGKAHLFPTLQALSLTVSEKSQPHLYQPGDMVRFKVEVPNTSIQKGSYLEVESVEVASGALILVDKQGNQSLWNPKDHAKNLKNVDVFRAALRELMIGDVIVWTRTVKDEHNKALHKIKDQKATVIGLEKESATVLLANGEKVILDKSEASQHWDHGYAVMLKNVELSALNVPTFVLQSAFLDNKAIHTLQEIFAYHKETRGKLKVLCDDVKLLKKTIESGGVGYLPNDNRKEIAYKREEALYEHQTIATQPIFAGLQEAYLKVSGQNPEFLPENLGKNTPLPSYSPELRFACHVVDRVCLYHSEREAVLELKKLKLEASQLGGREVSLETIDEAFGLAIEKGWLKVVSSPHAAKTLVASRHVILMEELCIQKMKGGQSQLVPIMPKEAPFLETIRAHEKLTEGQKKAVEFLLTTSDTFVAIQGIAGAGKTTAFNEINEGCKLAGFKTLVLADTGSATNQAKELSNLESMTTAQFLTRLETALTTEKGLEEARKEYGERRLIILDEASLISTQNMFKLKTIVEKLGSRLNYIGDFKQIGSIGAGEQFHDLLAFGVNKVAMTENVRLSSPYALAVMKSAYAGDMEKMMALLQEGSIEEIPHKEEALNFMAAIYGIFYEGEKSPPLVITPLNKDREFLNTAIREKLKERKILTNDAIKVRVYLPTDKHEIDKKEISSYEYSDVIRFSTNQPRLRIKSGDYLKIKDIDVKHHRLTLEGEHGRLCYWSPKNLHKPSNIEIYREEIREFMQGDNIVFKRNHAPQGIFNGDRATLLKIEGEKGEVLLSNNKIITLDFTKKEHQHLDYGYALTPNTTQSKTVDFTMSYWPGPEPYPRTTEELQTGDRILLPLLEVKKLTPEYGFSKLVEVVAIKGEVLQIKDKEGNLFTLKAAKRVWDYFPPIETLKEYALPLSITQQAFLVSITRGNKYVIFVADSDDFQKILEKHARIKESALSHLNPNWKALSQDVNRLVENISGQVGEYIPGPVRESAPIENKPPLQSLQPPSKPKEAPLTTPYTYPKKERGIFIDAEEIKERLARDPLGYAKRWFGTSPKKISGTEAKWDGAWSLTFKGAKTGWWAKWNDNVGGKDLISLYMAIQGLSGLNDWKEALKELAEQCGLHYSQDKGERERRVCTPKINAKVNTQDTKGEEAEQKKRIWKANLVYKKSLPLQGTLGEKYLREYRGITGELPADFRFNPGIKHLDTQKLTPALVAPIRDKHNAIIGIVRIFLNPDGSKLNETYTYTNARGEVKEEKATDKANLGLAEHGAVVVQRGLLPTTLYLVEGVETALSVAKAMPNQTVIASTGIKRFKTVPVSPEVQKIIICADNDGPTPEALIKAIDHHLVEGKRVFIAVPPELPAGMKGYDFNDVLKQEGLEMVKAMLEQRVEVKNTDLLKSQEMGLAKSVEKMRALERQETTQKAPLAKLEVQQKQIER